MFINGFFSKVDALCSSSENILEDVKKNFPIAAEKLHLIRYGRKTENFKHDGLKRQELRDKYGARIEQIVFGTLCRIDPGKGVRELVQALEYLNDHELEKTQLWIVGDPTIIGKNPDGTPVFEGPSEELSRWIAERMENPRYKDHIVRIPFQKNYVSYIDALDVFALASYNETYSLSVLDAMMMAKPVIGTNAGGTPEQVGLHHERGVLAEPKDAESLSQAFRHYLQRPEDIQIQGHKAQEWSLSKHNWPVTQEAFLSLYKSI
ncbi:glycosyltransferase family 4 protein [Bdellovibrio bacteriovorus]|uniref:glycosyltransferase family 4 protein n=1 Tax=Bdellovibrio bacteriovorus TaxID=959 RepID=UPI0035A57140